MQNVKRQVEMGLKEILSAARADIGIVLGVDDDARPLDARAFAKALFIAKRAENIASADGRGDEFVVLNTALRELEGKAPLTCAALVASLTGGDLLVQAKLREIESDRKKVLEASRELQNYEKRLDQFALTAGSAVRQLGSGDKRDEGVVQGEFDEGDEEASVAEEDLPDPPRPPALDLPRDAEAVADEEIEGEHAKSKVHPDAYRI